MIQLRQFSSYGMGCSGCLLLAWQDHRGQLAQRVPMVRLVPIQLCPVPKAIPAQMEPPALIPRCLAPRAILGRTVRLVLTPRCLVPLARLALTVPLAPTRLCPARLALKVRKARLARLAQIQQCLAPPALLVLMVRLARLARTLLCPVHRVQLVLTPLFLARLVLMEPQERLASTVPKGLQAQRQFRLMRKISPRLALMA